MNTYLARVEYVKRTDSVAEFFNVRPVMEFIDDGLVEVDEVKFGQYGTITIGGRHGNNDSAFIQDQKYSIFSLSDSELRSLEPTSNGHRIRAVDYISKCKSVESSPIREVISFPNPFPISNFMDWIKESYSDILPPITKTVYLVDGRLLIGPFNWEKTDDDQYKFIPYTVSGDPYMVNCYRIADFVEPIFTFKASKHPTDWFPGRERRILLNNTLPEKHTQVDCIDENSLKDFIGRLLSQSSATKREKHEIREAIATLPIEQLTEERQQRILTLVKNGEAADQVLNLIPTALATNAEIINKIIDEILNNANFVDKLYPRIKEQNENHIIFSRLEEEKAAKAEELRELEVKITQANAQNQSTDAISSSEVQRLSEENNSLKQKLSAYIELGDLQTNYEEKKRQLAESENKYKVMQGLNNSLLTEIQRKVQEAYSSFAFDGALSSLMLQESANFEKRQNLKKTDACIVTTGKVQNRSKINRPADLVKFVYDELGNKANRSTTINDVANILLCIARGFLTVFAGEPGTGKTSLVSLLANILGLNNTQYPRYAEIAVEKGWTSRRDFIGYYNPLTKAFESTNKCMLTALSTLDAEASFDKGISDFPYWILLDEANLSQMEHYWADFMSICDFDKKERIVSLSEGHVYKIPESLRFIATVNLDHTTEILSPRLIDRAWIIKLQPSDIEIEDYEEARLENDYPLVEYSIFKEINTPECWSSTKLDASVAEKFNRIKTIYQEKAGLSFSPRIISMIKHYCLASKNLMDSSENNYVALDYAVAQKLLPLINGYGETYDKFIDTLLKECDKNTMPNCSKLLLDIKNRGAANLQNYQFFTR